MNNPNNQTTHGTDIFEPYIKQLKKTQNYITIIINTFKNKKNINNKEKLLIKLIKTLLTNRENLFEHLETLKPCFNSALEKKLTSNLNKILTDDHTTSNDTTVNDAIINLENELNYFEFLDKNLISVNVNPIGTNIDQFNKTKKLCTEKIYNCIKSLNKFNDEQKKTKKIHEISNDDINSKLIHSCNDTKKKLHNIAILLIPEYIFAYNVKHNEYFKIIKECICTYEYNDKLYQEIEKNLVFFNNDFQQFIEKIEKIIESIKKGDLLELQNIKHEQKFSKIGDCLENLKSFPNKTIDDPEKKSGKRMSSINIQNIDDEKQSSPKKQKM